MNLPGHDENDDGPADGRAATMDRLLARTPQEHLRRAALIATNGANDAASRLLVIEHLLWALLKDQLNAADHT